MKKLKITVISFLLLSGLVGASAFAEAPVAPSNISSNDHVALANYYEGLAKEVSTKLETYRQELKDYEEHPYYYGRQGQDLYSHLRANIRKYENELTDDLNEAKLHRESSVSEQGNQFKNRS